MKSVLKKTLPYDVSLDRSSPIPLFIQIANTLRESLQTDLKSGRLKPGDSFATERAICEQFGGSVITAKRVLDDLASEGILVRQQGRGTYVARSRVMQALDHSYRFAGEVEEQGSSNLEEPAYRDRGSRGKDCKTAAVETGRAGDFFRTLANDQPRAIFTAYILFAAKALSWPGTRSA